VKIKFLIFVALVIQIVALLFTLVQVVEPHAAIRIGLSQLKDDCPAQALTITNTTANVWIIKTAGDWFFTAGQWYQLIIKVLCAVALINIGLFIALLFLVRKNKTNAPLK